jgi:sugar O-acyltransferase (sialic acid O-acetyltransferase NeuD family)
MKKKAVVIGYSGHAYVLLDMLSLNNYDVVGYCDTEYKEWNPFQLEYLGNESDINTIQKLTGTNVFIGIGDNTLRSHIYARLMRIPVCMPILIHPSAIVSNSVKLEPGVAIMAGAILSTMVYINTGSICNTGCIIEHECMVGTFSHIAPGAVLAGNVCVGNHTFIGANSVVRQGVTIGNNVTIGAGSVVVGDVPDGVTVFGNPAIRKV